MIIDAAVKSHGHFAVYATYTGSFGETARHLQRKYTDFQKACNRAAMLVAQRGALDAEVVDTRTRQSWFFD